MAQFRAAVVVVVVVVAALVGCGDRTPRPPKVDDPENQTKLAKLDKYIKCLENYTEHVFRLGDLVHGKAPTISQLPDPVGCVKGITAAAALKPAMPDAERAAAAFSTALTAVYDLSSKPLDDANRAAILAKVGEFELVQATLFDVVRQLNREVHADQIRLREAKEGKTLILRSEAAVFHAEDLIALASTTADRLDVIDVAKLEQQLAQLEAMEQDLSTYALAEPKETTEFDGFYSFLLHLHNFVVATRELVVRARDKVPYSDTEKLLLAANNEEEVSGTPGAVVAKYNFLVQVYGSR